jgi:hypothetical protein
MKQEAERREPLEARGCIRGEQSPSAAISQKLHLLSKFIGTGEKVL